MINQLVAFSFHSLPLSFATSFVLYSAMVEHSKFIVEVSVKDVVNNGHDTPIHLDCKVHQTTFKHITHHQLKRILLRIGPHVGS